MKSEVKLFDGKGNKMPLVLSYRHEFRGIFSQREILCSAIKQLMGCNDDSYEEKLIIRCPNGQIKFEMEDGNIERFCKFNYTLLCRELKNQSRIAIFDSEGNEDLFAIWLTPMNELFSLPSNKPVGPIEIEEGAVPVVLAPAPAPAPVARIFGAGPKMPGQ